MSIHKTLRLTQRRSVLSSLFGFTFIASVLTVSASNFLPCPARVDKNRFADSEYDGHGGTSSSGDNRDGHNNTVLVTAGSHVTIAKRPRRWIEEKHPSSNP
ncbi:hypothetical protein BDN72DRAFT_810056 [Pluteus cervinus]|uniref:Uncharacterized protein n=1 Tax=Pluteus cervinus TaxID=181527 RepID=A0ACD3BER1_9AGAR|nr:hypothetical protein BDN72DRAFT_810056 [Pluteus cervinus]